MREHDTRFSRILTDPRFRAKSFDSRKETSEADPRFVLPLQEPDRDQLADVTRSPTPTLESDFGTAGLSETEPDELLAEVRRAQRGEGESSTSSAAEETIPCGQPTRRLALVNFDWSHIRAVDILALMRSITPPGGEVTRVIVYPTELYLSRAEQETKYGPVLEGSSEEIPSEDDLMPKTKEELQLKQARENELIRKYERQRMRYFFALIECDSVETANAVYDIADGMEYERSSNIIDLRFIPDTMHDFESRVPRDAADTVPLDYMPVSFMTQALQHSHVQLTWDAGDQERAKKLQKRRFTEEELQDDDFKAYLASSTDSENSREKDTEWIQAYRKRLLEEHDTKEEVGDGAHGCFREHSEDDDVADNADIDMQVTFVPSLSNLGQRILSEQEKRVTQREETPWQARLRRAQERKREKRRQRRLDHKTFQRMDGSANTLDDKIWNGDSDTDTPDSTLPTEQEINDPLLEYYRQTSKTRSLEPGRGGNSGSCSIQEHPESKTKRRGEPESRIHETRPMIDPGTTDTDRLRAQHSSRAGPEKSGPELCTHPPRKRKSSSAKAKQTELQNSSDVFNPDDERFRALYEEHEFAIDPSSPHFGRSREANALLLRRRLARKHR